MSTTQIGYMEDSYLDELDYMQGQINLCVGMQVDMKVVDELAPIGMQAEMKVNTSDLISMQAEMRVFTADQIGMQADMKIAEELNIGMQAEMFNVVLNKVGAQVEMKISTTEPIGMQAQMKISERPFAYGFQADQKIISPDDDFALGMQAKMFPLAHVICGGYLDSEDYLSEAPYLAYQLCALQGMQVEMKIQDTNDVGMQAEMYIVSPDDDHLQGMQALMKIVDKEAPIGMQADMLSLQLVGMQVTQVIYSIETLRYMCSFPSRGTEALGGTNWTSVEAIRAGDFSPNNLNTDIFEERTETAGLPGQWELRCDSGQSNTFVDTIYIGDHNFSGGASVIFQASDDSGFGSVKYQRVMTVEEQHMYFILPLADFPPEPARYYRFIIQDGSNPDGSLRIGIILFGSSTIFTPSERFLNPVRFGFNHFKDTIPTEGYTNVSNDRAIRKTLQLDFEQLKFDGGNFANLRDYFQTSKTDLKCLIIPRPTRPSSLAVFSKLVRLPEERHYATGDDNHRIDLTLEYDETE